MFIVSVQNLNLNLCITIYGAKLHCFIQFNYFNLLILGAALSRSNTPVFYKFWPLKLPINLAPFGKPVVFLLPGILKLCLRCYVLFHLQLYLNCIFTYVLISFSHGYSATLAAKLIIELDLT